MTTGSLLFMSNATGYHVNTAFQLKMLLLAMAGLNMLHFQPVTLRGVATWDLGIPPPRAHIAGGLSVALWCMVIAAGRRIGSTL